MALTMRLDVHWRRLERAGSKGLKGNGDNRACGNIPQTRNETRNAALIVPLGAPADAHVSPRPDYVANRGDSYTSRWQGRSKRAIRTVEEVTDCCTVAPQRRK